MCLYTINNSLKKKLKTGDPRGVIQAWKVVKVAGKQYCPAIHADKKIRWNKKGLISDSTKKRITPWLSYNKTYPSGFHCCLTEQGAKTIRRAYAYRAKIVKVWTRRKWILAAGQQNDAASFVCSKMSFTELKR